MVDPSEWRKGAVKRLASIYDGIARASARNLEMMSEVSRALKDGAAAVRQSRRTSSGVRSKKSAFESSGAEGKQDGPPLSPAPNVDIRIPKVRKTSGGPSVLRKAPKYSVKNMSTSSVQPGTTDKLGQTRLSTTANGLSTLPMMLPTPPDSPADMAGNTSSCTEPPDLETPAGAPCTPEEVSSSSLGQESGDSSSRGLGPGQKRSMNQASLIRAKSYTTLFTSALAQASADQLNTPTPKIRVRDVDDIGTPSRDVSMSSVFATGYSSDQNHHPIKTPRSENTDVFETTSTESDSDLDAALISLRTEIAEALESDTSALVDAVRTFVGSLREITSYLASQKCDSDIPESHHLKEVNRLCEQARDDLQTLRQLIDKLKRPRSDMLELARAGPSHDALPTVSQTWRTTSLRTRIDVLHSNISSSIHEYRKHRQLKQVLTAVLAEKGNEEFLSKVEGWETGVRKLEQQFGSLLA